MNEIFLPGKKVLTVRDISSFAVRPENENALIEVKNGKHFAYRFRTNTNDGLLKESHIGLSGTQYGINWRYDKFRPLEQRQFPGTMTVSFEGAAKPVTAVFELSRLSTNKDWEAHTEVPGKYATLLIYNGVNITTVQKLLGHKSVKTTQIYTNVMDMTIISDLEKNHSLAHRKKGK